MSGQVERDAVAALDAERLEDVGEGTDLAVEVPVGQRPPVARLALPDEGGLVAARGTDVPIEAVGADIELAADEPLRVGRLPLENLVPGPHPLQLAGEAGPEALEVRLRALVDARIGNDSITPPLGGRGEAAVFVQERINFGHGDYRSITATGDTQSGQSPGTDSTVTVPALKRGHAAAHPAEDGVGHPARRLQAQDARGSVDDRGLDAGSRERRRPPAGRGRIRD